MWEPQFSKCVKHIEKEIREDFEFKVISGSNTVDETVQYYDDDFVFKVVRQKMPYTQEELKNLKFYQDLIDED